MKTKKKLLAMFLALCMIGTVFAALPMTASAETYSGTCGGSLIWMFNTTTGVLNISGSGGMYNYTSSNVPWKSYQDSIQTVKIGNKVTTIGNAAFYNCQNLTDVTIGSNVISIGRYAFYKCAGLTDITIPDKVISIGEHAFQGSNGLQSVNITDLASWCGIEFASSDANPLYYAKNLYINGVLATDITIPDTVTEIKSYAFYNCTDLTSVTIPDSVTSIGNYAFESTNLRSVYYSGTQLKWNRISYSSNANRKLYNATKYYNNRVVTFVGAYTGTQNVTSGNDAKLPASPEGYVYIFTVENQPWYGKNVTKDVTVTVTTATQCSGTCGDNLTWSLDTSTGVLNISGTGLMNNYSSTYESGKSVTTAPWGSYSSSVKTVTIGNGVKNIGNYAFSYCRSLTSVTIPDSATTIGDHAFYYCTGLTSITIGNSVKSIGTYAFAYCDGLQSVTIPDSVASIREYAFSGTGYYNNASNWENDVLYIGNCLINAKTSLSGAYTVKDGTRYIADCAFFRCGKLKNVIISEGVLTIGNSAFRDCTALQDVTIPNSVTNIGSYAFRSCGNLLTVNMGKGVENIQNSAFSGCTNLGDVCYQNTESAWSKIKIGSSNEPLIDAIKHFLDPNTDIFLDKVQSVQTNNGTNATMRFFFTTEYDAGTAANYGAYILPMWVFDDTGIDDAALVNRSGSIESGESYSVDLKQIPADHFDDIILALPFVKVDKTTKIIINPELYEDNTVNNTDIHQ